MPVLADLYLLCADTRCGLEDLPGAMDDRDRFKDGVREIVVDCVT